LWAKQVQKIARDMNLFLASRALRGEPKNQWAALCAAQKMASQKSERLVLVYLYNSARTHFIKNS